MGLRRSAQLSLAALCAACAEPSAPATVEAPPSELPPAGQSPALAPPLRTASPAPEPVMAALRQQLADSERATTPGCVPASTLTPLAVSRGAVTHLAVPVLQGRCYVIATVSHGNLYDVDGFIEDHEVTLEEDTTYGPRVLLGVRRPLCATATGAWRLTLRSAYGEGWIGVRVSRCEPARRTFLDPRLVY